jgi:hypothetical protein
MNGKWYKKIGNGQKRANSICPYVKHQTISMASCLESGFNRISRIKENVFGLNLKVKYKSNKEKRMLMREGRGTSVLLFA